MKANLIARVDEEVMAILVIAVNYQEQVPLLPDKRLPVAFASKVLPEQVVNLLSKRSHVTTHSKEV